VVVMGLNHGLSPGEDMDVAMELAAGDGSRQVGTHAYLLILYISMLFSCGYSVYIWPS
jgi:hypothetical protein